MNYDSTVAHGRAVNHVEVEQPTKTKSQHSDRGVGAGKGLGDLVEMKQLAALEGMLERVHSILSVETADLTTKQIRAFLMIAKASLEEDPLTTEDLRRFLNMSSQCAHKTVSKFVDMGLVMKGVSVFDARARPLELTDAGRETAERLRSQLN